MVPASSSSSANTLFDVSNFPKAGEFLDACLSQQYFVVCYGGAIRGGKTFSSLGALILLHRLFPGSRSVIVRDSLETLKKNTLPSVNKAFPSNFIRDFNGTDYQWRFTNSSNCMFMSENADRDPDMDRWNGLEYNFILLEQAEELREKTFFKAIERAGSYVLPGGLKQPRPIILITVNPTDTWVRKHFYEPWLKGTLPQGWLYIPARIDDNPHIPDSYKESLLQMKLVNPIHYDKFVSGNWDAKEAVGNEWLPHFNPGKHVGKVDYLPGVNIFQSWDANSLPYCAMFCAQTLDLRRQGGKLQLRIFKEYAIRSPNSGLSSTGKQFLLDRRANQWAASDVFLTGDASLKSRKPGEENQTNFKDVLAALVASKDADGLTIPGCLNGSSADFWPRKNPSVMTRRDFVNYVLAGGLHDVGLLIDAGCTTLIEDMSLTQLGVDGKLKEMYHDPVLNVRYQLRGHMTDCLEYYLCTVLAGQYEAFKASRGA